MAVYMRGIPLRGTVLTARGLEIRRAFDVVAALLLLLLMLPLMTIIAVAIWAEDGGPLIFSQTRLGQHGRQFLLHKFRKFKAAGAQTGPHLTLKDDQRMTRIGRALERTKLDELPQLWNILAGDMALVGPRPESLAFADCFQGACNQLLDFRPGIFGPCQAIFRNESAYYAAGANPEELYRNVLFPMKAKIDLGYYLHRTLISDLRWAVRTTLAVFGCSFLPEGAAHDLDELDIWVRDLTRLAA